MELFSVKFEKGGFTLYLLSKNSIFTLQLEKQSKRWFTGNIKGCYFFCEAIVYDSITDLIQWQNKGTVSLTCIANEVREPRKQNIVLWIESKAKGITVFNLLLTFVLKPVNYISRRTSRYQSTLLY